MNKISNLLVYGSTHALVDATCAGIIFSMTVSTEQFFNLVVLYNLLAFGLQALIGLVSDRYDLPRQFAMIGCAIVAIASTIFHEALFLAICLAGLGNACFHVGGGCISLNLTPKRASAPGIFVAPGALGLLIGTKIGTLGYFISWHFVLLLLFSCVLILYIEIPKIDYARQEKKVNPSIFEVAVLLLLLSIAIRSLVGLALVFPWKSNTTLLVILTLGVVLGKSLGGIMADRYGWIRVSVIAMLISSFLMSFEPNIPYLAIVGLFLFNMVMPVTLVAISNMFSGRPGFSFGLNCLALIIGSLPTFVYIFKEINSSLVFIIIMVSTISLLVGLSLYFRFNVIIKDKTLPDSGH